MIGLFADDDGNDDESEEDRRSECERCEDKFDPGYLKLCDECETLVCPDCRTEGDGVLCHHCRLPYAGGSQNAGGRDGPGDR